MVTISVSIPLATGFPCTNFVVRCSLTFLSIQGPGITRFCGLCHRHVLSESFLLGSEVNDNIIVNCEDTNTSIEDESVAKDDLPRLIELIVAAFDKCVYCGGHFIG